MTAPRYRNNPWHRWWWLPKERREAVLDVMETDAMMLIEQHGRDEYVRDLELAIEALAARPRGAGGE